MQDLVLNVSESLLIDESNFSSEGLIRDLLTKKKVPVRLSKKPIPCV